MKYPFEFKELLLTDGVLDSLGFTDYHAGSGDFGDRRLDLGGKVGDTFLTSKNEYPFYFIFVIDHQEPDYYYEDVITPKHFCTKDFKTIYFLHEMYEDILKRRTADEVSEFINKCNKTGMSGYLNSYLKYKNERSN